MKESNLKQSIRKYQTGSKESEKVVIEKAIQFAYKMCDYLNKVIFKKELNSPLPKPVIVVETMNAYGFYKPKNPIGFSNQIALSRKAVDNYTLLSAIIFHEMVHEFLDVYDPHSSKTRSYHCTRFRKISEPYSPTSQNGYFKGVTSDFLILLEKSNLIQSIDRSILVDSEELKELLVKPKPEKKVKQSTKLKKWTCGCTNVRCAVDLDAACNKCGQDFLIAD